MQVSLLIGNQYTSIDCQIEAPSRLLYEKISQMIQQDQNNFQLFKQTEFGPIVLDKNKTLSEQQIGQNNILILKQLQFSQNMTPSPNYVKSGFNSNSDNINQYGQGQPHFQQIKEYNQVLDQKQQGQFVTSPNTSSDNLTSFSQPQIGQLQNQLQAKAQINFYQLQPHTIQQQAPYGPFTQPLGSPAHSQQTVQQQQTYGPAVQQQQPVGPTIQIYPTLQQPPVGPQNQNDVINAYIGKNQMLTQRLEIIQKDKQKIVEELENLKDLSEEKDRKIKSLQKQIIEQDNKHYLKLEEINDQNNYNVKQLKINWECETNNLKSKIDSQKKEIKTLQDKIEELIDENNYLKRQTFQINQLNNNPYQIQFDDNQIQINQLKKKNQELIQQIKEKDKRISNFEEKTQELLRQLDNINEKVDTDKYKQNQNFNDLIQQHIKKIKQLESKIDELQHNALAEQQKRLDRDKEISKLKQKMEDLQNQIEINEIVVKNDKKIIEYLEEQSKKMMAGQNRNQVDLKFDQELFKLQENMQREINEKKRQDELRKEEEQKKMQELYAQQIKIRQERDLQNKIEKQQKSMKLRELIMNTQGILQVGLLVDVTGSMDQYKNATMNIIQRSMVCIKDQTNRDCEWGAVCYQDFEELKQKGQYLHHQFTRDSNVIINFLKNVACTGGGDEAEDLRNGIKQMINNLKWEKYFKIALLICDAPSHGKKWAGNVSDNHPNEDLEDALQQLINKNIVLIGIEFTSITEVMFAQMKNFYANQNKQSMLIVVDLKNKNAGQIQDQLVNIIQEASISITEVSQSGTKSKKQNIQRDGAFEALIKLLPDPTKFNLDPKITTIQTKFCIYKVEINQNAFQRNITSIFNIQIPDDYSVTHESEWNCLRTLKPFAFGQLKEVYLMKKMDNFAQNEVYVIKMPIGGQTYKSMNEALLECRSHLISKRLMQKFIEELQDKNCNILPIKYSDFLILKEHDTSFWIAERFFQGDFIKFNNNYGYINPKKDMISILAQVFSYYTYHLSEFQYMICDIQGVGYNFTDPAINTVGGQFDLTDQGQEGIGQFIISFEKNKKDYKEYLDKLELD